MSRLALEVTLVTRINGYWNGGLKDTFTLELIRDIRKDATGYYQRIDCFQANCWFHVGAGKTKPQTDKQILMTAFKKMFKQTAVIEKRFIWR